MSRSARTGANFRSGAEFGANGLGNGVGMAAHDCFALGLNHDTGQRLCTAIANDDPAGVLELFFGSADARSDGRNRIERLLFSNFYVDDDLGKHLEISGQLVNALSGTRDE